jgi:hypothetical protein
VEEGFDSYIYARYECIRCPKRLEFGIARLQCGIECSGTPFRHVRRLCILWVLGFAVKGFPGEEFGRFLGQFEGEEPYVCIFVVGVCLGGCSGEYGCVWEFTGFEWAVGEVVEAGEVPRVGET